MDIYIKNINQLPISIKQLQFLVHTKKSGKTRLVKKLDVISIIGESPIHNKWYKIQYTVSINNNFDGYVFEFLFSSELDMIIAERREIPIFIESVGGRKKDEVSSIHCIKWDWFPKTEWPEVLELGKKALKNQKRVLDRKSVV